MAGFWDAICNLTGIARAETIPHAPKLIGVERSPEWPKVRAAHLKREPECQVCGTRDDLDCHHEKPFHLFPELELVDTNLITLCRPHHLLVGHCMLWAAWNPECRQDAAIWRRKILRRPRAA